MKTEPYAWAHKAVLRRIRTEVVDHASALLVYHGLCEAASDAQRDEGFRLTQKHVSQLSGLSTRTVRDRLADLERVGAILRERQPEGPRCADVFTLLDPSGNGCRVMGNGCRSTGSGSRSTGNETANPLPVPIQGEESKNQNPRRPSSRRLSTPDRIALEQQRDELKAKLSKLKGLGLHEVPRKNELIAELEAQLGPIESRLADHAQAIAGGDR